MAPVQSSVEKHKCVRAKLSQEDKMIHREKLTNLTNNLAVMKSSLVTQARELANKHKSLYGAHPSLRSISWMSRALYLGGRLLQKKCAATVWNTFVSWELQAFNDERPAGLRLKMSAFLKDYHSTLVLKYATLTESDKKSLQQTLTVMRQQQQKGQRTTPRAVQKDVDLTFSAMDQEWDAIREHSGTEGFYMAVQSDVEQLHEPKQYFSTKALTFFQECLKLDPDRVLLQFEAWVVGNIKGGCITDTPLSMKCPISQEISECRALIQEGLTTILFRKGVTNKVTMNYDNYERKVEEWGAELKGWPSEKVVNPGKLGSQANIRKLLHALKTKQCQWTLLSDDEVEERIAANLAHEEAGETVYKHRKTVMSKKKALSAETIEDDE
ncbi:hypothetical protein K439DRAFT_1617192 [Ramaria rubella]|nr:hypothetical protein K439DRAFT_1617192 [Ramaria rubella]